MKNEMVEAVKQAIRNIKSSDAQIKRAKKSGWGNRYTGSSHIHLQRKLMKIIKFLASQHVSGSHDCLFDTELGSCVYCMIGSESLKLPK